jgi:DNA-binding transcriptional LysR family regulator
MHATTISAAAGGVEIVIISTRDRLDLARGEADIAVRMRKVPDEPGYFGQKIGRLDAGALCPARRRPGDRADHFGQPGNLLADRRAYQGLGCGTPDRGARRRLSRPLRKHPLGRRGLDGAVLHGGCRQLSSA